MESAVTMAGFPAPGGVGHNAWGVTWSWPEAMHELVDYLTEFELELAKVYIDKLKPDALFHHDDWGSQISTFISLDKKTIE